MTSNDENALGKPEPSADRYLTKRRRRPSKATRVESRTILGEADSDRARLLFSSCFRRLAHKSQVFALESAEVRTRLTHSLEVAHLGRYLVEEVFKVLDSLTHGPPALVEWRSLDGVHKSAIQSFVETACLAHDIGNPPFGHFGERAIREWFTTHKNDAWFQRATEVGASENDFLHFDGNKQGFRVLVRLQRNLDDPYGLNLTLTQLAATIKYPVFNEKKPEKLSFFTSEEGIKEEVWNALGLSPADRHPCSLLMEAADDLAYCISDLEDGFEKGLLRATDLAAAFDRNTMDPSNGDLTTARTDLTVRLVERAAEEFVRRLREGEHLTSKSIAGQFEELGRLAAVTRQKIYSSQLVLANEITGFAVIPGLLDHMVSLLQMQEEDFRCLAERFSRSESIYDRNGENIARGYTQEPGLLSLLSRKYLRAYLDAVAANPVCPTDRSFPELFHRLHLVLDWIAGMTDPFALQIFRLVSGQSLYEKRV